MAYSKNRRLAEIVSDTSGNLSVEGIIVPTQSSSDNDTSAASTAFVHAHIDAVLDAAPGTLNTLNEIAAALNDDANFNTTVTNAIAAKLPLAGGTMTGALNMGSQNITGANRLTLADGLTDTGQAGSATVFNESGSTADFRIESDSNAHMFFLDAGQNSIGINNSSPSSSYALDVNGQIRTFGNAPALNLREDDSSNQHYQLGSFGGAFAVRDVTGSSYPLQISSGNVGIGGTPHSSGRLLVTNGGTNQIVLKGASGTTNLNMGNFVGGGYISNNYYYSSGHQADDNSKGAFEVFIGDDNYGINYHAAGAAGTRRRDFAIDNTGKVGIGTNTPAEKLEVKGAVGFEAGNSTNRWSAYTYTDNTFRLNYNGAGADEVTIDANGNFGIGTTDPGHPLSVRAANAKITAESTADAQRTGFQAKYLDHATLYGSFEYTTGDAQLWIDNNFTGAGPMYSDINFRNKNTSGNFQTVLKIKGGNAGNNGYVGIGTASPNFPLHLHKAAVGSNYMQITNSDTGTGAGDGLLVGVASDETATFWNYENEDMVFGTNGTERMRITNDGKVGIGTVGTNPAALLEIVGSGDAIRVESTNSGVGGAQIDLLHFTPSIANGDIHAAINMGGYYSGTTSSYASAIRSTWKDASARETELEFFMRTSKPSGFYRKVTMHSDSGVEIQGPNTSNAEGQMNTVIGFYNYYKTSPGASYAHMKTNFPTGNAAGTFGMLAIEATGYKYNTGDVIKGMWGTHNWNGGTYQQVAANLISSSSNGYNFCSGSYVSSDGYIVLVANSGGSSSVYLGARLDFIDCQADYPKHSSAYWPPKVTAISWSNNSTGVY